MSGGGAERQITYLAGEHVRAGGDIHVALIHGGANLPALEASKASIHRLGVTSNYDPRIVSRLIRLMRHIQPNIVQCWLTQMEVVGGLAAAVCRLPWVISERASEEAYPRTVKNLLRERIAAFATAIVSNSETGDRYWRARTSDRMKRYVIPNGVPLDQIAAAPVASADEAGVPRGAAMIIAAGRMVDQKNFETFLRALALIRAPQPVFAICFGEGPLRARLEQLVVEHRLEDRVRLAGYTADLWALMKGAAMFVSPSFFEGSPNTVLEAMACGCPLVVSNIPEHRELLDEDSAMLVDPANPKELAEAMTTILSDPEGAQRRARAGRARVERYSFPAIARRYAQVYDDVLRPRTDRVSQVAL
jgi:glycosyltransferase involved in cell wall biosynthesis